MKPIKIINVIPLLPTELEPIWHLAYNHWFTWNHNIETLFAQIDPLLWNQSYKNPVWFLNHVSQTRLKELANDTLFKERLNEAVEQLRLYTSKPSPHNFEDVKSGDPVIAYFSLEFGVSQCLPIYSGGLGILAGDHLKSASDLNVPLIGMGLAYQQGYFRQYMNIEGWQQERYPNYDFDQMPMRHVLDQDGNICKVHLNIGDRPLVASIWVTEVGRISLYLLDTNLPENPPEFRPITSRLYFGDNEMRLWQEMLLGIGGIKALKVIGVDPKVIHMNEGHSAFAGLERVREFMKGHNLSFEAAVEVAASGSIFTTHTPVPAGNDRFPPDLMQKYFEGYARDMGLAFKVFMALGRENPHDDAEHFCMPVLALRLSRFNNGVSTLHGHVSRNMWKQVWNQFPVDDMPIGSVTNGIHAPTWVSSDIGTLFDRYLGLNWREEPDTHKVWSQSNNISDSELWRTHERLRARLVDFARERLQKQLIAQGASSDEIRGAEDVLNPDALTIGFARRFATYKRATLLLQDKEALLRIVSNKERPVQFIFAGKAHPQDNGGKKLMQDVIALCRTPEFRGKLVFLEDYDMEIASYLVSGCDIWLNNPRRPLEACGTSGMKAMFNGVLQFSTLDGWWDEAWKDDNSVGWAIGGRDDYDDPDYQDCVEIKTLYNMLENEIISTFYERGRGGLPRSWVQKMKLAFKELCGQYSSHRMVNDYLKDAYMPAYKNFNSLCKEDYRAARELAEWRTSIMTQWGNVNITDVTVNGENSMFIGDPIKVEAKVFMGNLDSNQLLVEVCSGTLSQNGDFVERKIVEMKPVTDRQEGGWRLYQGEIEPKEAGRYGVTVRAMPHHALLSDARFLGLIRWAQS
ncbi:alpha-glucan family phosphorylase [Desulfovibrio litoralis]|uniref:Starch phosphorylase n=1 Tax=Desulfovibrio litoralis DSM 11393 TaxID=1121455 RepID=A0A1M7TEE2_9BACT|nr:alpha-glucan family phosphorylase [Desulfovibrio litoralis]SHN69090.1 starch phosphorylase [Desulfovibrio litoralis DSM 11393]